jgi:hypothetical protein
VLGTQMERHIAKRFGIGCAVISAPVHVQDFPARYAPQMGFEGANVIFDTWVHPLMMGLEEHLIGMFREDFEFSADSGPSHLGAHAARADARRRRPNRPMGNRRRPTPSSRPAPANENVGLDRRGPEGTEEDPVLRARQGAPQHRGVRRRAGCARSRRDALRCQSALRTLKSTPVRVVMITLDNHLAAQ